MIILDYFKIPRRSFGAVSVRIPAIKIAVFLGKISGGVSCKVPGKFFNEDFLEKIMKNDKLLNRFLKQFMKKPN